MKREEQIDNILDSLVKSGSNIEYLEELRKQSLDLTKNDISLKEVLDKIALDIKINTNEFLNRKNQFDTSLISGISTCIYLPDLRGNGDYKIKLIGGDRSRNLDFKVDETTMFDVASITKLYTLISIAFRSLKVSPRFTRTIFSFSFKLAFNSLTFGIKKL